MEAFAFLSDYDASQNLSWCSVLRIFYYCMQNNLRKLLCGVYNDLKP
jgi:hypothetical protein